MSERMGASGIAIKNLFNQADAERDGSAQLTPAHPQVSSAAGIPQQPAHHLILLDPSHYYFD